MKAIKDLKLKRREEMIKSLKEENEKLKKELINQESLRNRKMELEEKIFQIEELRKKLNQDIQEFEEARDAYLTEKKKFAKLNIEYKRKMENFFDKIKIPEQEEL